jgi:hypothetical protein
MTIPRASRSTVAFLFGISLCVPGCHDADRQPTGPCGPGWHPVVYPERNHDRVTIQQGIAGDVWFWEGDFMPMCPRGTVRAVAREMRVYELTPADSVEWIERDGGLFIRSLPSALIAAARSDSSGFFEIALPVGRYTLLALEDSLLYGNSVDGEGNLSSVEVWDRAVTDLVFGINYRASF